MQNDEKQQRALIEQISRSPRFKNAQKRCKLLEYLFERYVMDRATSAMDITIDVLELDPEKIKNDATARVLCGELRDELQTYEQEHKEDPGWHVDLPQGHYLLRFRRHGALAPTDAFWYAHLRSRQEIFVVCNEPVVFRDYRSGSITRYTDVNTLTADRRSALLQLKTLHFDAFDEAVVPSYFYLYSGEILAADELQRWFLNYGFERLERKISRLMPDNALRDSSPILLGNSRVNRFIDAIFCTKEGRQLAYQISQDQFGITTVRDLHEHTHEQAVIDSLEDSIRYEGNICYLKDCPHGDVFVLVTRLPNPFSDDPNSTVTILSCDYTRAVAQVALLLTTDRLLAQNFSASTWPPGVKVARAFQVLYAVQMGTSNIEAAGPARFITARGPKETNLT